MRRAHLERFRPICPVCRADRKTESALDLAHVWREEGEHVLEGALHCTERACLREYPILDGVPILIGPLRSFLQQNPLAALLRRDLSHPLETLIGDCCGPGSTMDLLRQHVSTYAWDHYEDLAPAPRPPGPEPGAVLRLLEAGLALGDGAPLAGPILDVGTSLGRTAFALAEKTDDLVLGVDLNIHMLRIAGVVLREGRLRYPLRRVGLVYDDRAFPVALPGADRVDLWCADATDLPFATGAIGTAISLNLLDCLQSPRAHLERLAAVLQPGGRALVTTPFDWSSQATPFEAWLGGHSQRGPEEGRSEAVLRSLVTGEGPHAIDGLRALQESPDLPWTVRVHDRHTVHYRSHTILLERT